MSEITPTERTKAIGERIKKLRAESSSVGYAKWAIKRGFDPRQYYRLEAGTTNFTISTLERILKIHDLNLEEFFKGLK
ncbi:MAG: helix-turn-helix transcriptional regulator [Reichenbachiella sp.]|uniref:helix-turn-helix domain-containing protein n=1 Tax=Reichenbachiella sp. TaxID=2184521 RepID=UPI0032672452